MITVHHLNNSRSQRIIWFLEELGVPYDVKYYVRDTNTQLAPPELKSIHPLGKSPIVCHAGRTIAESGAIVDYLIDTFGNGRLVPPVATAEFLRYRYWIHFSEGSAMPPLLMALLFRELPKRMPLVVRPIGRMIDAGVQRGFLRPTLEAQMALMQSELATGGWFAGAEFTSADVMMSFPIETLNAYFGLEGYPALQNWLARAHERPAYQAALKIGGPYAYSTTPPNN